MELKFAIKRLSALAHEGRLTVFRLLVKAGPDGIAAGDIAQILGMQPNTLSTQLGILANAGLVGSRRTGRSIIYSVDFAAMTELLIFLTEDCCGGRSEICAPLVAIASQCCAADGPSC